MMTPTLLQIVTRLFLVITIVAVASSSARPHFENTNQVASQDSSNAVDSTGLTNDDLEQLLRLVEYNNRIPQIPSGWERLVRGPEMKRQSRFRQCYFNPVSCFKK